MKKVIGFVAPIAIYFVVEYFGGPLWGMVAGCVLSVIGLIASRVRGGSLTWGSFGDLGLVVLLGLVDIATERLGRAGIGEAAFAGCTNLYKVLLPFSFRHVRIKPDAFKNTALLSEQNQHLRIKRW